MSVQLENFCQMSARNYGERRLARVESLCRKRAVNRSRRQKFSHANKFPKQKLAKALNQPVHGRGNAVILW